MSDTPGDMDKLLRAQAMVFEIVANGDETLNTSPDNLRSIAATLRAAASLLRDMSEREKALAKAVWFTQHMAKQPDAEAARKEERDKSDEEDAEPDFEGAYDMIIHLARDTAKALEAK